MQYLHQRAALLPGPNITGVVMTDDGGAIIIDTGLEKEAGRLIRKTLDGAKYTIRAIINTHHHADHIGGNDYLLRNVPGLQVAAPPLEAALITHPQLQSTYLSMGAAPLQAMHTKWVMGKGSPVHTLIDQPTLGLAGVQFTVIQLPGHSPAQIGLIVDRVCYAADGLFIPGLLDKYGVPFAHDVAAQLASFETLANLDVDWVVPGHGDAIATVELPAVLEANRRAVRRASEATYAALSTAADLPTVAERVSEALGCTPGHIPQHLVFLSAIAAHLNYLAAQGQARPVMHGQHLYWEHAR